MTLKVSERRQKTRVKSTSPTATRGDELGIRGRRLLQLHHHRQRTRRHRWRQHIQVYVNHQSQPELLFLT